ncbi:DUF4309 domain-containing protein [Paenibacillus sp. S3N08]|uniref:DUF4309 domain-containing protein n=2 Tax=Paenibacillus agricola TaxID=2716264 RepID=A0ABX0J4Z6_9BACL|nr:DUF4309 domain-containing protein [Paenibacillus agricola]
MLLSGCYHTPESVQQPEANIQQSVVSGIGIVDPSVDTTKVDSAIADLSEQAAQPVVEPTPATPAAEVNPSDKVSLASVEPAPKQDPVISEVKPAPSKPKIDIRDSYNQAKPTLIGLTLNTSMDKVVATFGKPKEQFIMDEENDPITVYDYTDFLIGFNKQKQLRFIDIRSAEINPGLNGLKLGQSTSKVYEALGKPDSNTSFVFTYNSTGAVLKLDVDPKTDKVNSIKLFTTE